MWGFDSAVADLTLATGQAEALRRGLSQRQDDLLAVEETIGHLASGLSVGRIVIDQAEDVRRTINAYAAEQLQDIQTAVICADQAVADAAAGGELPSDRAQMLSHLVNSAGEDVRQTIVELDQVGEALARIARAHPDDPGLARPARSGVDEAANRLEHARRSVFRIVEALPPLIHEMWSGPESTGSVSNRADLDPELSDGPVVADSRAAAVVSGHGWLRPVSIAEARRDSPGR